MTMRASIFVLAALALLPALALADPPSARSNKDLILSEPTGSQSGLESWVKDFRGRALSHGISAATFDAAMTRLTYLPDVVRKDRHQNEFTKTIWDYLDSAVSVARITSGQAALAEHREVLDRIEATYGVDKQVILAIWGLESAYGAVRGDINTIEALATLAYDGRRGAFFEGQLLAALQILQAGDVTPANMRGSWAGAMGHTQFMPTSFLSTAVDFNGDGRRDIWSDDPVDALASTAAYLAKNGWQKGAPWGVEVSLPLGFDYGLTTDKTKKSAAEWQALGVTMALGADLPDFGPGSILLPGGARGVAFLIFHNFQVIETYNSADAYVIAVGHLADRILGAPDFHALWPRDLRALTFDERIELQQRLSGSGFDTLGIDSKMGPRTIAAIMGFQRASGLIPDGFPSTQLMDALRNGMRAGDISP